MKFIETVIGDVVAHQKRYVRFVTYCFSCTPELAASNIP